ncbi:MAG: hypothetical protein ACOYNN_11325 [Terrimicrobiaceae bacterium]
MHTGSDRNRHLPDCKRRISTPAWLAVAVGSGWLSQLFLEAAEHRQNFGVVAFAIGAGQRELELLEANTAALFGTPKDVTYG